MKNDSRPKIGLALGAGSARGLAHIGVLQELEKLNIPIDYIAGTSMGALVGSLYSVGIDPEMISKLALNLSSGSWTDWSIPKKGLIAGDKIEQMLKILTKGKSFDQTNIPFKVVATDITNGDCVVIDEGPIYKGVRASISIPGIFKPVEYLNRVLVDGAVVERVPISIVKKMGADIVIAVDVTSFKKDAQVNNIFSVLMQTFGIMEDQLLRYKIIDYDVIIKPNVAEIDSMQFDKVEEGVVAGKKAVQEKADEILKLLDGGGKA
ncbi:patatin-like phospholipase family protein [Proteinivorax hydrogeniformans]|uniref:Patatin-like phospholipase family protein n=1 Tax=Proteinivorax hydrogeniformans TaxID=1826727 RepID=A0AAU8HQS0_9FIRM